VTRTYRVVLLDLFGTVVHFAAPAPGGGRATFDWLRGPLATQRPGLAFDDFRRALFEVSAELLAARAPEHREVPSRERFRLALARADAGADPVSAAFADAAEALSLAHMAHLAAQTETPAAHVDLLRDLAQRYRVGLVSNFDHGPTARAILLRHGVADSFHATLISDDFGRRKPHPAIFHAALDSLDAAPHDAIYVGDTAADDVAGAQAAGIDVAWLNRRGEAPPDPPPTYTLRELTELRSLLR
jgi:HAD superfamily hydrolase (TIGR01549 family)